MAAEVAARLRLPLVAQETVEEALAEGLGRGGPEGARRLEEAAGRVVLGLVEASARVGASLVLAGGFVRGGELEARLAGLPARLVQLHDGPPLELPGERIRLDAGQPDDPEDLARRIRRAALWQAVAGAILAAPTAQAVYRGDDPPELAALLGKVRRHAYRIVDADVAGLDPDTAIEATLGAALAVALAERRRALEAIDAA
ncbi:MAG TPA: hypothetical protein VE995_07875 [Gaiellaceae bacterium]|nr:hypothetical protein [Gaiellaceae bacterium]